MTSLKDREEGFERKFVMDEEQRFRATVRRNKLLGMWAAQKLGKTGEEAEAYAKEVVVADIEEAGGERAGEPDGEGRDGARAAERERSRRHPERSEGSGGWDE